jgi:hypothetical protein
MENLGIFYDHLVYFTAIGTILWPFVYFVVIWYIFPRFGILDQEKSGNPEFYTRVPRRQGLAAGLPDCSWYNIPKQDKIPK